MCIVCEIRRAIEEDERNPAATDVDGEYVMRRVNLLASVAYTMTNAIRSMLDSPNTAKVQELNNVRMLGDSLFSESQDAAAFRDEMMAQLEASELGAQSSPNWLEELFASFAECKQYKEAPSNGPAQAPQGFPAEVWAALPESIRQKLNVVTKDGSATVYVVVNDKEPTKH